MCVQDTWITGIEWDEFLPAKEFGTCGLHQREKVVKSVYVYTFVNASQKVYGAVAYIR